MNIKIFSLTLLLVFGCISASNSVFPQSCGGGIPSANNPSCIPPPTHPNSPIYQGDVSPTPIWADRWGAIAFDSIVSLFGAAKGMQSKQQAELEALNNCRKNGGTNCWIELTYYNQCGVIAWGEESVNAIGASNVDEASEMALRKCKMNSPGCQIVYSGCSLPEQLR